MFVISYEDLKTRAMKLRYTWLDRSFPARPLALLGGHQISTRVEQHGIGECHCYNAGMRSKLGMPVVADHQGWQLVCVATLEL